MPEIKQEDESVSEPAPAKKAEPYRPSLKDIAFSVAVAVVGVICIVGLYDTFRVQLRLFH